MTGLGAAGSAIGSAAGAVGSTLGVGSASTLGAVAAAESGLGAVVGTGSAAASALGASAASTGAGLAGATLGTTAGLSAAGLITYGSLASTLATTVGSVQQAGQQKALGKLQQAGAGAQGASELLAGANDSLMAQRRSRMAIGQALAQSGANGLQTSGSVQDFLSDMSNQGSWEVQNLLQVSQQNYQSALMSGEGARISADAQSRSSLAGGFANLAAGTANTMYLRQITQPRPLLKPNLGRPGKNPLFEGY